ncbi:MAG TPA: RNA 3'-phosphate cyclase [Nitrospiraceae bacterium]|nr:RNA 3'-phosphate cyclase [Nitrospiraceae bacterium]
MIEIDGSFGEGGGQVLRTALSLSCHLKKSFRIFNIRAQRKKPGLQPQHLTCVRAAQLIAGAEIKGDFVGSSELIFNPDKAYGGHYRFDIGTAGSTSLVFQTILLPLCFAEKPSGITITGGTHVPWSPPFHYLKEVFLPVLKTMGIDVSLSIERWGFYPKGGGIISASIAAAGRAIKPISLEKRGEIKAVNGLSATGNLPSSIAERQRASASEVLKTHGLRADIGLLDAPCIGQGTFFFIVSEFENSTAGFSALGQRGKKAEDVGKEATEEFLEFFHSGAPVEKRLADQIVPYMALSKDTSSFITSRITMHLLTNIWVIEKFLDVKFEVSGKEGEIGKVVIRGRGSHG